MNVFAIVVGGLFFFCFLTIIMACASSHLIVPISLLSWILSRNKMKSLSESDVNYAKYATYTKASSATLIFSIFLLATYYFFVIGGAL